LLLTRKLLNQGFLLVKLKSSLRKFYSHHHDIVNRYGIPVSLMTMNIFQATHATKTHTQGYNNYHPGLHNINVIYYNGALSVNSQCFNFTFNVY